jgi:hypothetical protein
LLLTKGTLAKLRTKEPRIDGRSSVGIKLGFADGSTLQIKLADPASSVMLRDKQGKLEYAD